MVFEKYIETKMGPCGRMANVVDFFVLVLCIVYQMLPVSLESPVLITSFGFLYRLFASVSELSILDGPFGFL
jgi:hypothetical protein